MGVNVTVVPVVLTRHGPGGWMEMIATLGNLSRAGGPGGTTMVSIETSPPGVSMFVREHPPGQLGSHPTGKVNGTPMTTVLGEVGASWTLTTSVGLTVTVTGPSGVCTLSG